jgi:hypothetical protein
MLRHMRAWSATFEGNLVAPLIDKRTKQAMIDWLQG